MTAFREPQQTSELADAIVANRPDLVVTMLLQNVLDAARTAIRIFHPHLEHPAHPLDHEDLLALRLAPAFVHLRRLLDAYRCAVLRGFAHDHEHDVDTTHDIPF